MQEPRDAAARRAVKPVICYPNETLPLPDLALYAAAREGAEKVAEYKAGKEKLFGFFVGQVMKATQGKANPAMVNRVLKDKLAG